MEEKDYQFSLGQLMRVALKQWWIILLSALIIGAIAFAYVNFFVTPKYTANAKVGMTSDKMSEYQGGLINTALAKEGADILESNITLDRAAKKLNAHFDALEGGNPYRSSEYKWQDIKSMIKTSIFDNTRYFDVKVTSESPEEAALVAKYVIDAYCEVLAEKGKVGEVINLPVEPTSPSSPNKTLALILGVVIGAFLSLGVLLIVHFSRDILDGEDWIIETYKDKIPMLAVVPDANSSGHGYKKYGYGYGYK